MKKILLLCMLFSTVVLAQNNLGQLAYQYFQQGEYSKAIEIYKELNQKNVSASYFNPYLNCLIQIEDYKSAEKLVSKIIRKYPKSLNYQVDLGFLQKKKGKEKKSKKRAKKITQRM